MQSQNPFSTSHLWNFNQNKGPKHYNDFVEAQQLRDDQRLAFSANTMREQKINSPVLQGSFTDVRPQSPAMAQAQRLQERQTLEPYNATTGGYYSGAELEDLYRQGGALHNQVSGRSYSGAELDDLYRQDAHLKAKNYNRPTGTNSSPYLQSLGY